MYFLLLFKVQYPWKEREGEIRKDMGRETGGMREGGRKQGRESGRLNGGRPAWVRTEREGETELRDEGGEGVRDGKMV